MAISNYLQKCEYKLGGLKPHIYLIHKDALTVKIKANGVKVSFNHIKKGKDEDDKEIDIIPKIYKIEGALCVYNQEETFASKYRFNSTLEVTINELYKEPFFYGLRTLRTNQYYIIIEDKKGTQYLINPELYTNLNYEYNFTDTTDGQNAVLLTWYNLSNFPLLIFENKVETDTYLLQEQLNYNLGHSFELVMSLHKDINTNDDGVKVTNLYIDSADKIKKIEYLKETFNLNETYDGNMFRVTLSYSIPLDSHQFEWHYNLLEFKDNLYTAVLRTTNDNYIVVGVENGLFPSYNITTSEEDETPNMVNITFTHLSQYPILYTDDITQFRWIPTDEICFGFDKYQMLTQQYSEDWGVTWETTEPEIKKKGDIIEVNSEDCKEYQWVDDGTYCYTSSTQYIKWIATDDFVCENGDKYQKLKKHITVDGETFNPTEEYAKGNLIEKDSQVCKTIAIRWVDITNDYLCFPVNEEYTRWIDIEDVCVGKNLMKSQKEEISNNGILYYESGDIRSTEIVKENCCACGYVNKEYRYDSTLCSSDITDTSRIFYPSLDSTSPTYKKSYALYDKYYEWEYCYDDYATIDTKTNKYKYILVEENSCSCGYTGLTWQWDGEEYICGNVLCGELPSFAINSVQGNWLRDGYTFTSNDINDSQITVERIYFSVSTPTTVTFTIDQSSETCCDYLVISNLDKQIVSGSPTSTGSSYNYYNHKGKTTSSTSMTISDTNEHFIELMYRKDGSQSSGRDNVIVTLSIPNTCAYDITSKYEVWRETNCDKFTGNIEYRNPKKSYDCGWVTYQWIEDENNVCGGSLPSNTTEVNKAPELNTDFE